MVRAQKQRGCRLMCAVAAAITIFVTGCGGGSAARLRLRAAARLDGGKRGRVANHSDGCDKCDDDFHGDGNR